MRLARVIVRNRKKTASFRETLQSKCFMESLSKDGEYTSFVISSRTFFLNEIEFKKLGSNIVLQVLDLDTREAEEYLVSNVPDESSHVSMLRNYVLKHVSQARKVSSESYRPNDHGQLAEFKRKLRNVN